MEGFNGGRNRNWLWCVIFPLSIFPFLFYFYSSNLICSKYALSKGCRNNLVHSKNSVLHISPPNPITDVVVKPGSHCVFEFAESVTSQEKGPEFDSCSGKYIYVHNLPCKFNANLLEECKTSTAEFNDMCAYISNGGLGTRIVDSKGIFSGKGWYATNQFQLSIIFYNRMKRYECLTRNSSLASAIYVPYFPCLEIARHLLGFNISVRDSTSLSLLKWLRSRPEWQVFGGRDHFMVSGRITWEFRRGIDEDSAWGNNLMLQPETMNMTMLSIESSPWHSNDIAIPYPTYFHPSTDDEVFQWQRRMRRQKKYYLFSFIGNPRPHQKDSVRNKIIEQCQGSKKCKLLQCGKGKIKCYSPSDVIELFQQSVFCLQPSGDSPTRRSAFDAMLAGCIPVFFHPASAYVQYIWHLPRNYRNYSVFIPEDDIKMDTVNIEATLNQISAVDVIAMREEVIRLIPKLIYAHPKAKMETIEDAFDIAVQSVIERINKVKRQMKEGWISDLSDAEDSSWKSYLVNEWDHFFSFS